MKKINFLQTINKQEWLFVFYLSIITIIITTLPYLYAYFVSIPNNIYNGLHSLTPGDMPVYFSYIEQVKQGRYLFDNLFTSEKTVVTFNIFWLAVGLIGKFFNLNTIITFHLGRILLIPVCLVSIYLLISYFFNEISTRKISLIFITFSSGMGALFTAILPNYLKFQEIQFWPLDLWAPEYNIFLTLYHSPHIIASMILILLLFFFFLLAIEQNKIFYSILSGLCGLLLIQFHPFHLPTIWLIPFFYVLTLSFDQKKIKWQDIKHLTILGVITLPSVLYYLILMNIDWATKVKALQNVCYTSAFPVVLISYGGLIILAIVSTILAITHYVKNGIPNRFFNSINGNKVLFLIIWSAVQFVLIFIPFRFQRRLTEGLQIPLALLSIIIIIQLKNFIYLKIKSTSSKIIFKMIAISFFIIFFTASNWFLVILDIKNFKKDNELFYLNKQQLDSYNWLKTNTNPDDVSISFLPNGIFIPGVAGRKVYFGHVNVETLYYDNKLSHTQWFFKENRGDDIKKRFLTDNNISYIYFSKYEKELGSFDPDSKNYLIKVYHNDFASIYKVEK